MKYIGFDKLIERSFIDFKLYPSDPIKKVDWLAVMIPERLEEEVPDQWMSQDDWTRYIKPLAGDAESSILYCCETNFYSYCGAGSLKDDLLVKEVHLDWAEFDSFQRGDTEVYCIDDTFSWGVFRPDESFYYVAGEKRLISDLVDKAGGVDKLRKEFFDFWSSEDFVRPEFANFYEKMYSSLESKLK